MYPILFSCSLLGPHFLGMTVSVLHFLYLTGPYPWNIGKVWFIFPLCVVALCMMYVCVYIYIYICLHVCGWLCTLYDGLSKLREWPSLVIKAFDLIVWVCAQSDCRRCIFMLYCVHDHCGDCFDPCYQVTLVSLCMRHVSSVSAHLILWGLRLVLVWACRYAPYTLMRNLTGAP